MQKKTNSENSFSKKQIPSILFCCKTQKYEPLHNSQDEVSRQEDVPFQEDASSTNSLQGMLKKKKSLFQNPIQTYSLFHKQIFPSTSKRD
jgi:hypothetical protein